MRNVEVGEHKLTCSVSELKAKIKELLRESDNMLLLETVTAVDESENKRIRIIYVFYNLRDSKQVIIETSVSREKPVVPSLIDYVPAVYPYELEIYDLFGVIFEGNNSTREGFFKPLELKGVFPLLKAYKVDKEQ